MFLFDWNLKVPVAVVLLKELRMLTNRSVGGYGCQGLGASLRGLRQYVCCARRVVGRKRREYRWKRIEKEQSYQKGAKQATEGAQRGRPFCMGRNR